LPATDRPSLSPLIRSLALSISSDTPGGPAATKARRRVPTGHLRHALPHGPSADRSVRVWTYETLSPLIALNGFLQWSQPFQWLSGSGAAPPKSAIPRQDLEACR